jgi:UDP-N-acetylmuramoyl-tripeptide--D-alanyl-D-alanine ligase
MTLTLEFFIEALTGQRPDSAHPVDGVAIDSRQAAGRVFAALPGEKVDGHAYVASAFEHGALAALVDREVEAPCPVIDLAGTRHVVSLQLPVVLRVENVLLALQEVARQWCRRWLASSRDHRVIGITGSVGKTTTKELVADVLGVRYRTLKSPKSYNNEIGIPVTVLDLREEHQRAVLEMSMYVPGEIRLLASIAPPQVGVVTLIAPVHLERAGSMEAIVNAKAELVEALPPDGVAILNRDEELVMSLAQRTAARIVTYGLTPAADIWAEDITSLGLEGVRFWMHYRGERYAIKLPMLGRHSVHTALRAAAVGFVEGLRWDEVVRGLQSSRSQLRLIAAKGPRGSVILDDTYNASPPSTIAALNLLNDLLEGRRIAVLGDMLELGSYEERGHRDVGIRASAVCDLLVTVGPRGRIIGEEALRCRMPAANVRMVDTPEQAIEVLLGEIQPGDAILVKGSRAVGMERVVSLLSQAAEE